MFGYVRGLGLAMVAGLGLLGAVGEAQAQRYYYYDDGRYDRYYGDRFGGDRFRGQRFYDPGYDIIDPEDEEELYLEPEPRRRRAPRRPEVVDGASTRQVIANPTNEGPGTIVVDTRSKNLYLVMAGGQAMRYRIGVGREGFGWRGTTTIGRKAKWPEWRPPAEMRKRQPYLPVMMEGGLDNPLGARALYLHRGSKDTLYRIHGTNDPSSIGRAMSSGCFRMMNDDVVDLYERVGTGTRVVVL